MGFAVARNYIHDRTTDGKYALLMRNTLENTFIRILHSTQMDSHRILTCLMLNIVEWTKTHSTTPMKCTGPMGLWRKTRKENTPYVESHFVRSYTTHSQTTAVALNQWTFVNLTIASSLEIEQNDLVPLNGYFIRVFHIVRRSDFCFECSNLFSGVLLKTAREKKIVEKKSRNLALDWNLFQ